MVCVRVCARARVCGACSLGPSSHSLGAISLMLSSAAVEMVATLCDLGADVNGRGSDTADTPLFMAACYPNPHMERLVRLLLERGANPQLKNIDQRTAAEECANVWLIANVHWHQVRAYMVALVCAGRGEVDNFASNR